jgi:hypothetical protein
VLALCAPSHRERESAKPLYGIAPGAERSAHGVGYLIGGAFFGVHLLLLGILIYRVRYLPRLLGILLALAAAVYLVECFGSFLFPSCEAVYVWLVAVPAAVAELPLALWLLIKGIRTDCLSERPRSAL